MKRFYFALISLVFVVFFLSSCTIQKRVHQRGYHIAWSASHKPKKLAGESTERTTQPREKIEIVEAYPTDEINFSSSNSNELIVLNKENVSITNRQDTVVPNQSSSGDEYFDRRATPLTPNQFGDLPGKKEANLALTFGILAITSPIWILIIGLIMAISSQLILQTLALYFALGIIVIILLTVVTFALSIHFLKNHGSDPSYAQLKNRAVTGLILASIIPGIVLISIILAAALA